MREPTEKCPTGVEQICEVFGKCGRSRIRFHCEDYEALAFIRRGRRDGASGERFLRILRGCLKVAAAMEHSQDGCVPTFGDFLDTLLELRGLASVFIPSQMISLFPISSAMPQQSGGGEGEHAAAQDGCDGPTGILPSASPSERRGSKASRLADGIVSTLATAAANSSANSNAVSTLDTPFSSDPPTLADMEVLRAKVNEMISTMGR